MHYKVSSLIYYLKRYYQNSPYFGFVRGHDYLEEKKLKLISDKIGNVSNDIIDDFEKLFSLNIGDGESVSFGAGRMGFYSLMKVLDIGEGDDVILPGHTCSVMPNAVIRTGANPIFSDIDPDTFGSSAIEIEKVITNKTKLIVAQHSFGIPCDIHPIVELAKLKNIFLVEDCAITFGSRINNIPVGNFGDAALFSLDHTKPINTFLGGLIYSKDKELYDKLKEVQNSSSNFSVYRQKVTWKKLLFEQKYYNPMNYSKSFLMNKYNQLFYSQKNAYLMDDYGRSEGFNYPYPAKLPTFLALLGIYELGNWKFEKNKRKNLLLEFLSRSSDLGITEFLPKSYFDKTLDIVPLRFIYRHPNASVIRKKMSKYIDINLFWFLKPIITCSDPRNLGYIFNSCPISEIIGKEIINWPCIFSEFDNERLLKYYNIVHS